MQCPRDYIPLVPIAWDCGRKTHPQRRKTMASDGRLDYSVYSGRRPVTVRKAWSGAEAVIEYLTTLGIKVNEVSIVGPDAVTWRGATFRAVPVPTEPPAA